jgi:2,3-bisphosphoglycerate-independent phosphoglycerate mutase
MYRSLMKTRDGSDIKIVYVLVDGVADLPHPNLNGLTPLDAAYTPNMDYLAKNGCMGETITLGEGIAPDIAVFNMLGYSFRDLSYVGRGVIESIGSDIDFRDGDPALRGNLATVDEIEEQVETSNRPKPTTYVEL